MPALKLTMRSGFQFESELTQVITRYSKDVYRNIRIETLLTANGLTEIDILLCYKDIVFIIEAKNVASIVGDYDSKYWTFIGARSVSGEEAKYTALNTITQNNIHVRAFKDYFYSVFNEWPIVIPIIVTPQDCKVSTEIAGAVYTISQLDEFLASLNSTVVKSGLHRKVFGIIQGDNVTLSRSDFVLERSTGKRVKGDVIRA